MLKDQINRDLLKENQLLKEELLKSLKEKENLVLLCDDILTENEKLEKRYNSLSNSKLGRLTLWIGRKKANAKK